MKKRIYIESSIPSYLTARPSRDVRTAAWQQLTSQWWEDVRPNYELFTSALVITEVSAGNPEAAKRRLDSLEGIPGLLIDKETEELAAKLISEGGMPSTAQADALHVAVAAVHGLEFLLTWNCRHIDNATTKPIIRSICTILGYTCPEICTPLELLTENLDDV